MSEKQNNNQTSQEEIRARVQARLDAMEASLPTTSNKAKLEGDDKAIAKRLNKGQEDSGYKGSGADNLYKVVYHGKFLGTIKRVPEDGETNNWVTTITDTQGEDKQIQGIRQSVGVQMVKAALAIKLVK